MKKSVKEGGRADYAAKDFVKKHFGVAAAGNPKKRLGLNAAAKLVPGHLPGIPPGTMFYARAEMEAVGFHSKQASPSRLPHSY